ncbi:hypothetical protein SHKM778_83280 [Streptomyces sp. KM77-8]|uniref:Uncharacterized protein n=1 Tax=Streptomyces haneummycinicus TaxID=3074435 RepID=A0AAT9HWL3_9ACTN
MAGTTRAARRIGAPRRWGAICRPEYRDSGIKGTFFRSVETVHTGSHTEALDGFVDVWAAMSVGQ